MYYVFVSLTGVSKLLFVKVIMEVIRPRFPEVLE